MKDITFFFKTVILVSLLLFSSIISKADERITIVTSRKPIGSGAPVVSLLSAGKLNAFAVGGQGKFFITSKFALGGFGGGIVSHSEMLYQTDQRLTKLDLGGGFGGINASYSLNPIGNLLVSIPFELGIGGIGIEDENDNDIESSKYYHLAMGVEASIPLGEHFAPTIRLSYLHTILDRDLVSIKQNELSGLQLSLCFNFL